MIAIEAAIPYGMGDIGYNVPYIIAAVLATGLAWHFIEFKKVAKSTVQWFAKTKFQLKYKKPAPSFDLKEMAEAVKDLSRIGPSASLQDIVDLASLMEAGVYVRKNVDVAYKLMRQLGLGGNAAASFTVYMAYRDGKINVSKDESKRQQAEWFNRALTQGFYEE